MFSFIRSLFNSDPSKKLSKVLEKKRLEALMLQRNGDLRSYAKVMKEIADIEDEMVGQKTSESGPSPDFIDYDGMGNQGRFPVNQKKKS